MTTAEVKYNELKEKANALMIELAAQLKETPNNIDWGHVGSLNQTIALLNETLQFSERQYK